MINHNYKFILVFLFLALTISFVSANDINITWTQRTSSFSSTNIKSVAYGNGIWVAVGASGKLATATDPTGTWTQRTSSFGTSTIYSVAYNNGVWVAVGSAGKLATATDPTETWTQRTSSFGTTTIFSIAYNDGVWVAVGDGGKIATATNPTGTWTQRTSSFNTTTSIMSVAYGNDVWVAVESSGKLATATDPTGTWTQRTSSFGTTQINSVAYDNSVWVAVGWSGKLATATNPTGTWTQRTSSFDTTSSIMSIAYGNGIWVIAGNSGQIATATDPTGTWTQRTSSFGTTTIQSVAYGNDMWVAVGNSGKLATAIYAYSIIDSLPISSSNTGTYNNNFSVTLDNNNEADIYYTTDGSDPDNTDTLYSGAISITDTTTLKAISWISNENKSGISSYTYTMVVADPNITIATGTYNNDFTTTITSATTTASIYYTTNGDTPDTGDTLYSGAISITGTTTLKAKAFQTGYTDSGTDSETYTMVVEGTPIADKNSGLYYDPINVTLTKTGTTTGTTLTYTLNGTDPTIASTEYTTPIVISADTTLKFAEFKTGYTATSIVTKTYEVIEIITNVYFYDENTLLPIPEVTITDANGSTYTSDINGFWTTKLLNVAKNFTISKTGYGSRKLQFYFPENKSFNFTLNQTGLDSSIGFIVKDSNNNLWTNKYLQFKKNNFDDNWTQRTSSFGTSPIYSVAYGNGVWVAVGHEGKLATATDPTGTWTQRTSSFGTTPILSVAYGNGIWVAVGQSGKLATATDPTGTWTQRTSSFGTHSIYSVTYDNGVWVAVGDSGKLATATDPTETWTLRINSYGILGTNAIYSVAYGNGIWVIAGNSGKLATATDPTETWTLRTSSFDTTPIRSVAYSNSVWVAVGQLGKLATATDPTDTWTQRTSSFGTTSIYSVAYDNGVWVAVGHDGKLAKYSSLIIINSLLTSSSGIATANQNPNIDYNFTLYDELGVKHEGGSVLKRMAELNFSENTSGQVFFEDTGEIIDFNDISTLNIILPEYNVKQKITVWFNNNKQTYQFYTNQDWQINASLYINTFDTNGIILVEVLEDQVMATSGTIQLKLRIEDEWYLIGQKEIGYAEPVTYFYADPNEMVWVNGIKEGYEAVNQIKNTSVYWHNANILYDANIIYNSALFNKIPISFKNKFEESNIVIFGVYGFDRNITDLNLKYESTINRTIIYYINSIITGNIHTKLYEDGILKDAETYTNTSAIRNILVWDVNKTYDLEIYFNDIYQYTIQFRKKITTIAPPLEGEIIDDFKESWRDRSFFIWLFLIWILIGIFSEAIFRGAMTGMAVIGIIFAILNMYMLFTMGAIIIAIIVILLRKTVID